MSTQKIFITGISTDVGKTIVAAVVTEALGADYWKPIQAGELENCDTKKVQALISNTHTKFHKNSYALHTPMSPDAAAAIDGVAIELSNIHVPATNNKYLVIEGAGGVLVPLNKQDTIADLIKPTYKVIVVSRHYLGSINHTLLTVKFLQEKGFDVSLVYSGAAHKATEDSIHNMTGARVLGRIEEEAHFDTAVIAKYARLFKTVLKTL